MKQIEARCLSGAREFHPTPTGRTWRHLLPAPSPTELLARACTHDAAPCPSCLAGRTCEGSRVWLPLLPGDDVPGVEGALAERTLREVAA